MTNEEQGELLIRIDERVLAIKKDVEKVVPKVEKNEKDLILVKAKQKTTRRAIFFFLAVVAAYIIENVLSLF